MPETKPSAPSPGEEIGQVISFFAVPSAAIVEVKRGTLKVGDTIWIRGHTTDLKQTIDSMQIEHQSLQEAKVGQQVGIKVASRVRRHDLVYKIS
ncbi:MAG: hypothetical protein HYZ93_04185 [Candidatus Omnitrophica bacterium]|nr:hypothetical protein [Candidatus Omnitrophota bacterium]